jgi:hypothetical protein
VLGKRLTAAELAGCKVKAVAGNPDIQLCVGPLAPAGDMPAATALAFAKCARGEQTVGCEEATVEYITQSGCSSACLVNVNDEGPRGQTCAAQTAATCKTTAVPCGASTTTSTTTGTGAVMLAMTQGAI